MVAGLGAGGAMVGEIGVKALVAGAVGGTDGLALAG